MKRNVVVEGVFPKGDLKQAVSLGIVSCLEVEGDGDGKLDAGDTEGLRQECGRGFVGGARHNKMEKIGHYLLLKFII